MRESAWSAARTTFASLANPNYRKYVVGQGISLVGTWMQSIAQSWLVLVLTHSATDIGVVVALQTLPTLILGPYAGVIADRVNKRRLMMILQAMMGVQAAVLALVTFAHAATFADVSLLAVVLGVNNAFENPIRQTFVLEMVGPEDLRNAVSLNSTMVNVARALGPAIAGILIATVGEAWCFALNALSFVAVVASLAMMDVSLLHRAAPTPRAKGQLREGLAYVRRTPALAVPLVMMALVGTLAYEFQVTMPVLAERVFHHNSVGFGELTSAMGLGAVVGGLVTAARGSTGTRALQNGAVLFALSMAGAALMPTMIFEDVAFVAVGYASVAFLATANSTLQLAADPQMRGRVMSLWAVAFLGSTPVGGPLVGWITNVTSARWGLGVGALSCALAAGLAVVSRRRGVDSGVRAHSGRREH
ncbi:MAG: MFS transporter [Acidimicrobiaceae bacterium]|nr:MFS transporter [Acidimicrobiaceae bacterium]